MRLMILAVGSLLFSASAMAADAIQIDVSRPDFAEQQRLVLKTIHADVKYSEMSQSDRQTVESSMIQISEVLAEGKTIAMIDAGAKQKVDTQQTEVNKLLSKAFRDSRLVCTKAAAIGTNMLKRTCKTAAARNRDNDISRTNGIKVNQ